MNILTQIELLMNKVNEKYPVNYIVDDDDSDGEYYIIFHDSKLLLYDDEAIKFVNSLMDEYLDVYEFYNCGFDYDPEKVKYNLQAL